MWMIIIHAMNDAWYLPRLLSPLVKRALKTSPVVVVSGARQTGKSTLVQRLGPDMTYETLDDVETLDRAEREPDSLLRSQPRSFSTRFSARRISCWRSSEPWIHAAGGQIRADRVGQFVADEARVRNSRRACGLCFAVAADTAGAAWET